MCQRRPASAPNKKAAFQEAAPPEYTASGRVDSPLTYVPGVLTDLRTGFDASDLAENELLGVSHSGMGGDLYVNVTMDGDTIRFSA